MWEVAEGDPWGGVKDRKVVKIVSANVQNAEYDL